MDHLIQPLEQLYARAVTFVADRRVRLLHVAADEELFAGALATVMLLEWSPRNHEHYVALTSPEDGALSWPAAERRLAESYARICAAYQERSVTLPPLPSEEPSAGALLSFAATLQRVEGALSAPPAPTEGLVALVSARSAADARTLHAGLATMIDVPSLAGVRWIVVDHDDRGLAPLLKKLGPRALQLSARVDRNRQRTEVDGLMDALVTRGGRAAPTVPPPPRPGAAPAPPADDGYLPPFLQGVKALRRGDLVEAVKLQREAYTRRLAGDDLPAALEMGILLGVYMSQLALSTGDKPTSVVAVFQEISKKASENDLLGTAARAAFLEGVVANAARDIPGAVLALQRAATLAETAGSHDLQVEALKLSADAAARVGMKDRAAEFRAQADQAAARAGQPKPSVPESEAS
jgi:hypothetical protein